MNLKKESSPTNYTHKSNNSFKNSSQNFKINNNLKRYNDTIYSNDLNNNNVSVASEYKSDRKTPLIANNSSIIYNEIPQNVLIQNKTDKSPIKSVFMEEDNSLKNFENLRQKIKNLENKIYEINNGIYN